jgi:hypothetical protein
VINERKSSITALSLFQKLVFLFFEIVVKTSFSLNPFFLFKLHVNML